MSDDTYLRRAIEVARDGMHHHEAGPFGAVVVKQGQVVAEAFNEVTRSGDPSAHAEVLAIRRACQRLSSHVLTGCSIYSSCEPCPMCLGAVYWARLDRLVFAAGRADAREIGFDDDLIYHELQRPFAERRLPTEQRLQAEARDMMQAWLDVDPTRRY
jgi:tRNA(Arg) A34 adenosine deaminase TadA